MKIDQQKLTNLFKKKDKTFWIVLVGFVGIALILLSEVSFGKAKAPDIIEEEDYTAKVSAHLEGILSKMNGAGDVSVLITLEKSSENIYVYEEKSTTDTETGSKTKQSSQTNYIFVDDGSGGKQALVRATIEPVIKGVLIVCDGAGDPNTYSEMLSAVTTLLNISSAKVHITQKG